MRRKRMQGCLSRVVLTIVFLFLPAGAQTLDEAILRRELELAERTAQGTLERADVLFEMGFRDRAWLQFKELRLADVKPESRARYFWLRGRLEQDCRRPKLALKNFHQVERESPGQALSIRLFSAQVKLASEQGDTSRATTYRDKLNSLSDAEHEAALATARILASRGENEAALSVLRALVKGARGRGLQLLAQQRTLELALLLDKMNRGPEAWRAIAQVVRESLAAEREWLAAQSFEVLGSIRKRDGRIPRTALIAEIQEAMPRSRLGLRARSWSIWGQDREARQKRSEEAFALSLELDEPHIAALFAVRRADFAASESDRERWSERAYQVASSRPAYDGYSWFWWAHPQRLEQARVARAQGSNTQQFSNQADFENDPARRLYMRNQALQHSFLENDAPRCLNILPLFFEELVRAPTKARQGVTRDAFWSTSGGLHWSATPQELSFGGPWDTPVFALTRRWVKARPKMQQTVLDVLLEDLAQAKAQGDLLVVARAQESLSALLAFVGRETEGLALARESMRSYDAAGNPMRAAEVLLRLLATGQFSEQESLVTELVSRYKGREDSSLLGTLWISRYYRETGQPSRAEDFLGRYLAAPSGRTNDSRRASVFLELASLQRARGDFQDSLGSLASALEYGSDRVLSLAQARTYLKLSAPGKALEVLSFDPGSLPASRIQKMRLQSQAFWALNRKSEAEASDRELLSALEDFLSTRYHPELDTEVFSQPMVVETLKELRQRNSEVKLSLPSPKPLPKTFEKAESTAEALERLQRRSPLARKNLELNLAELEELQSRMGEQDALVHLFPLEESLGVIVVQKQGLSLQEYVVGSDWRHTFRELKGLIATPQSDLGMVEERATELGDLLIAPWAEQVKLGNLYLMASGELSGFPLEILKFGSSQQLRTRSTAYFDSGRPTASWLGFPKTGALIDGSQGLAGAKRELGQLSQLMPHLSLRTFSGDKSTFKKTDELIHICSHGTAPDSQALMGRLLAGEEELDGSTISQLSLRANQLLVLSSCSGGVDPYSRNSLAHLFRAAGAGRVVASLWPLDDQVAPILFKEFYQRLQRGQLPSAALSGAKQDVAARFPHPYYWSGVVLYQNLSQER